MSWRTNHGRFIPSFYSRSLHMGSQYRWPSFKRSAKLYGLADSVMIAMVSRVYSGCLLWLLSCGPIRGRACWLLCFGYCVSTCLVKFAYMLLSARFYDTYWPLSGVLVCVQSSLPPCATSTGLADSRNSLLVVCADGLTFCEEHRSS
jgi:hypothetical protein